MLCVYTVCPYLYCTLNSHILNNIILVYFNSMRIVYIIVKTCDNIYDHTVALGTIMNIWDKKLCTKFLKPTRFHCFIADSGKEFYVIFTVNCKTFPCHAPCHTFSVVYTIIFRLTIQYSLLCHHVDESFHIVDSMLSHFLFSFTDFDCLMVAYLPSLSVLLTICFWKKPKGRNR